MTHITLSRTTTISETTFVRLTKVGGKFCLRLLLVVPRALAAGIAEAASAVGQAADMAYVDPFMSRDHYRK